MLLVNLSVDFLLLYIIGIGCIVKLTLPVLDFKGLSCDLIEKISVMGNDYKALFIGL